MSGDNLDLLSPADLQDKVREQAGQLAVAAARHGELGRSLAAAEQDVAGANESARAARVALERELATSQSLREEREALRRQLDGAQAEARAARQVATDARAEANALRANYHEQETRAREATDRLEAVRRLHTQLGQALE